MLCTAYSTDRAAVNEPFEQRLKLTDRQNVSWSGSSPTWAGGSGTSLCLLPGGYVAEDGVIHREAELSPLTGREEDMLGSVPPDTCAASVVTALLSQSLKRIGSLAPVSRSLVSNLLTGDRDYLMLRLREMTFGPKVEAIWRCANLDCRRQMDVAFSLADLTVESKIVTTRFFTHRILSDRGEEELTVEFRLPTGADQEALAPVVRSDESRAISQLLVRCVRRVGACGESEEALFHNLPAAVRDEIVAEIEGRAPQVVIELDMTCPECRTSFSSEVDFTAFFLAELKTNLRVLEREVHFLAWHYHWSEHEILSLMRRKRQRYVTLLQEELDQFS
jgi:hypothetical protein